MPKSSGKKAGSSKAKAADNSPANVLSLMSVDPQRAGMPAADSIIGVRLAATTLAMGEAIGGGATQYRIIETNEMNEYETGADSPQMFAAINAEVMAAVAPAGDKFQG